MQALLCRLLPALFVAVAASQGGEFTQQYRQRLGGAAEALRGVVERFDAGAAASGLTGPQAESRLRANPDALVARQGSDAAASRRAFEAAERRRLALAHAAPILRPLVIFRDPDWAALRSTAADFEPALALGSAGLLVTFGGFVGGWALGAVAEGGTRLLRRRARRPGRGRSLAATAAGQGLDLDPPL